MPGWTWGRVDALAVEPNGALLAATRTTIPPITTTRIVRRQAGPWTVIGTTIEVYAIAVTANGVVFAGGNFGMVNSVPAANVAQWDGTCWSPLGTGTNGVVLELLVRANGELVVSGWFSTAGGVAAQGIAVWNGATWTAAASGLPQQAFVVGVSGLAPASVPLTSAFAQAGSGCTLHVAPDLLALSFASSGTASSELAIPASAALVGQTFDHQLVALEFTPLLQIVAVTATNAARMTIGAV